MTQYTIYATAANSVGNIVTVNSVGNMFSGLPIVFSGNTFGGITAGATYYIGAVIPGYPTSTITLSSLPGGATYAVSNATGNMTAVFSSGGQQIINTVPPGESLTDAFTAVNVNFDQLFAAGPVNSNIQIANNTVLTTNTNGNINLVPNGIGAVVVNSSVIPDTANIRNLGSVNNRFSTIYAQYYNMSGNLTPENINTGNLTASGYISAVGNITGNYFFGNGSQLTGVVTSTGNIGFSGDAIYDLNGIYLENADLTQGATAAVVIPTNGSSDPVQINNTYGNIVLQAGVGAGLTAAWKFGNDGNLSLPAGNLAGLGNVIGPGNIAYPFGPGPVLLADNSANNSAYFSLTAVANADGVLGYVGIANFGGNSSTGLVETVDGTGNSYSWYFQNDGTTAFPNYTFPNVDGANGQALTTNGTGILSWSNVSGGSAAGNAGDIQINVAGNIGADSTLRYVDNGGEMTLYADYLNAPGIFTSDIYAGDGTPSNITLTTSYGNATWTFGTTGNLSIPGALNHYVVDNLANLAINYANGVSILNGISNVSSLVNGSQTLSLNSDGTVTMPLGSVIKATTGSYTGISTSDGNTFAYVDSGGFYVYTLYNTAEYEWHFDNSGNLTLPGAIGFSNSSAVIQSIGPVLQIAGNIQTNQNTLGLPVDGGDTFLSANANVNLQSGIGGTNYEWSFGVDGNLILPRGGVIYETNIPSGFTGNTIALAPSGGSNIDQQLLVYPTVGADANHLHLTSGNVYNTELFLGNDDLYVKLANTGNVVINSNDNNGNTAQWTFGTDRELYLPTGGRLGVAGKGWTGLDGGNGNPTSLTSLYSSGMYSACLTAGIDGSLSISTYGDGTGLIGNWIFDNTGNLSAAGNIIATGTVSAIGNITANYFIGNGSQLTGLPATYGNSNVATLLSAFGSNSISTTGNISAGYLFGNASQLTGLPATYGNANVAAYLPTYSGNLNAGNIISSGNANINLDPAGTGIVAIIGSASATGNIVTAGNFVGNGAALSNVTVSVAGNIVGTQANVGIVAGSYTWTFDNTGNVTLPAGGDINMTSASSSINVGGTVNSYGNTNGTAFAVIGNGAQSNVALGFFPTGNTPAQMAIRDYSTANSYMYFDATAGSANTGGTFAFRSSNAYTVLATINTYGVSQPTKPGFRVYGNGVTGGLNVTTNGNGVLNGNNWAVDYNQGSYLNSTTGVFVAPAAGLYQVNLVARVANNTAGASQAAVIKNAGTTPVNQVFWEVAANCTVNHFGVGTVSKLAVGDTLTLKVTQGNVTFDGNDNWSVAFLG